MSPSNSEGRPVTGDRSQSPQNNAPEAYPVAVISPSAVERQVDLAVGIARDAAQDRATREITEGGVDAAVDVHDAVLLDAALQLLQGTPYTVVCRAEVAA